MQLPPAIIQLLRQGAGRKERCRAIVRESRMRAPPKALLRKPS